MDIILVATLFGFTKGTLPFLFLPSLIFPSERKARCLISLQGTSNLTRPDEALGTSSGLHPRQMLNFIDVWGCALR